MSDEHPLDQAPLSVHVERSVNELLTQLGEESMTDLYEMVIGEVERPLLSAVLILTNGNQTQAAHMLGLNRGTLRKKLKQHGLLDL